MSYWPLMANKYRLAGQRLTTGHRVVEVCVGVCVIVLCLLLLGFTNGAYSISFELQFTNFNYNFSQINHKTI